MKILRSKLQQVFNYVNQHYLWITTGNQRGYDKKQLDSAKVSMDNVLYVLFTKPPDTNTSKETKDNDDNT